MFISDATQYHSKIITLGEILKKLINLGKSKSQNKLKINKKAET